MMAKLQICIALSSLSSDTYQGTMAEDDCLSPSSRDLDPFAQLLLRLRSFALRQICLQYPMHMSFSIQYAFGFLPPLLLHFQPIIPSSLPFHLLP